MIVGPKNPPVIPIEETSAMPPAAAGPLKNADGRLNSTAKADCSPIQASVSPAKTNTFDDDTLARRNPAIPSENAATRCQTRSPLASLERLHTSMAATAARLGRT